MRIFVLGSFAESLINFRGPLLKTLVDQGHEVFACAPDADESLAGKLVAMGVEYHHVPLSRAGLNPFSDLQTILALWRLCRKIQPDVFLGYTIKPIIYGSMAASLVRTPHIFSIITGLGYAFGGDTFKQHLVNRLASRLYQRALACNERVFFQNPDDLEEFRRRGLLRSGNQAMLVNGSGVDVEHFATMPVPKSPVFLFVGRLLVDKGVREYAEAAAILRQRYPTVRCLLLGWIDENPAAIKREELDAWVRDGTLEYLGYLEDVRSTLASCSVYVLPSYREGTPRTVLEAMAMGRAVVTTDTPGCRETIIDGDNGYLVPARDVSALVDAMASFVKQPQLAIHMGERGRIIAEQKYDVHKVNSVILQAMHLRA